MGAGLVSGSPKTYPIYFMKLKDFEKLKVSCREADASCCCPVLFCVDCTDLLLCAHDYIGSN